MACKIAAARWLFPVPGAPSRISETAVQPIQGLQALGQMARIVVAAMRLLQADQQLGTQTVQSWKAPIPAHHQLVHSDHPRSDHLESPAAQTANPAAASRLTKVPMMKRSDATLLPVFSSG